MNYSVKHLYHFRILGEFLTYNKMHWKSNKGFLTHTQTHTLELSSECKLTTKHFHTYVFYHKILTSTAKIQFLFFYTWNDFHSESLVRGPCGCRQSSGATEGIRRKTDDGDTVRHGRSVLRPKSCTRPRPWPFTEATAKPVCVCKCVWTMLSLQTCECDGLPACTNVCPSV